MLTGTAVSDLRFHPINSSSVSKISSDIYYQGDQHKLAGKSHHHVYCRHQANGISILFCSIDSISFFYSRCLSQWKAVTSVLRRRGGISHPVVLLMVYQHVLIHVWSWNNLNLYRESLHGFLLAQEKSNYTHPNTQERNGRFFPIDLEKLVVLTCNT